MTNFRLLEHVSFYTILKFRKKNFLFMNEFRKNLTTVEIVKT